LGVAFGLNCNAEVITVPNTFIATVEAIKNAGEKAVLCDIDNDSGSYYCREYWKVRTKETKAIIAVHLMGSMCDMSSLKEYCAAYDIWLIEDSAKRMVQLIKVWGWVFGGFLELLAFIRERI